MKKINSLSLEEEGEWKSFWKTESEEDQEGLVAVPSSVFAGLPSLMAGWQLELPPNLSLLLQASP